MNAGERTKRQYREKVIRYREKARQAFPKFGSKVTTVSIDVSVGGDGDDGGGDGDGENESTAGDDDRDSRASSSTLDIEFNETTDEKKAEMEAAGYRGQLEVILTTREGASEEDVEDLIRTVKQELLRRCPRLARGIEAEEEEKEKDDAAAGGHRKGVREAEEGEAAARDITAAWDTPIIERCAGEEGGGGGGIRVFLGTSCGNLVDHALDHHPSDDSKGGNPPRWSPFDVLDRVHLRLDHPSPVHLLGLGSSSSLSGTAAERQ